MTEREQKLEEALENILYDIDYTTDKCKPTEMIAAILPPVLIRLARKALAMSEGDMRI